MSHAPNCFSVGKFSTLGRQHLRSRRHTDNKITYNITSERISKSASRSYCMNDSAVCTKKQTIKTVINIKLRSACGAIVSATFLYGAPIHKFFRVSHSVHMEQFPDTSFFFYLHFSHNLGFKSLAHIKHHLCFSSSSSRAVCCQTRYSLVGSGSRQGMDSRETAKLVIYGLHCLCILKIG